MVVIVVENDEAVRHSIEWLISASGHEVLCYACGKTYLSDAGNHDKPRCFVLDIHIPGLDGIQLYTLLKLRYPDVPAMFITGYPEQDLARCARQLEPRRFFVKPLDTDAFLHCLNRAVSDAGYSH